MTRVKLPPALEPLVDKVPGLLAAMTPKTCSRRPPGLTDDERMEMLVAKVMEGCSVVDACPETFGARSTLYHVLSQRADLQRRFELALQARADFLAEESIAIADTEADPAKARNRIDARWKLAGAWKPRVYSPKAEIYAVHTAEINMLHVLDEARSRLISMAKPGEIVEAEVEPSVLANPEIPDIFS